VNKEIAQSFIFSLRADVAIATSVSYRSILVFPTGIDYRGLAFFCVGAMDDDEQAIASNELLSLGCDDLAVKSYLNTDALVGCGMLIECIEYLSEAQWSGDREFHGCILSLAEAKKTLDSDRVFGYIFQDNKFSQQPVEGIESAVGEYWQVKDIRQIYRCEELYKRPFAVLEGE